MHMDWPSGSVDVIVGRRALEPVSPQPPHATLVCVQGDRAEVRTHLQQYSLLNLLSPLQSLWNPLHQDEQWLPSAHDHILQPHS